MFLNYCLWGLVFQIAYAKNEPVWKIEYENRDEKCESNCTLTRSRMCGSDPCDYGVIRQHIFNCGLPHFCSPSDQLLVSVKKPCKGKCDKAIKQVYLRCANNPRCVVIQDQYCTDESGCVGQWAQWGDYEDCNSSGRQLRKRICRLPNGRMSVFCQGSSGNYSQISSRECGTSRSLDQCQLPPSDRSNIPLRPEEECRCLCQPVDKDFTSNVLYEKCEASRTEQAHTSNGSCSIITEFQVSCESSLSTRSCVAADSVSFCNSFQDWSAWGQWIKRTESKQELRFKHRWCGRGSASPILSTSDCRRHVRIHKLCKNLEITNHTQQNGLNAWAEALIAILCVCVVIVLAIILFRKYKTNSKKTKKKSNPAPTDNKEMMDKINNDVFLNDDIPHLPPIHITGKRVKQDHPRRLTVLQRFKRASDHIYDSVPGRRSIASLQSNEELATSESNRCDRYEERLSVCKDKCGVGQELEDQEKKWRKQTRSMRSNARDPCRISVTITNPEGMEMGTSVYKAKIKQPPKRKKISSRSHSAKKRWGRVSSQESSTAGKRFFPGNQPTNKKNEEGNELPLKSENLTLSKQHRSPRQSPSIDRYGLKNLLQRIRKPAKRPKITTIEHHQYDAVPKESTAGSSTKRETRCSYTAHQITAFDKVKDDDESLWSDSTFDDDDFSPPPNSASKRFTRYSSSRGRRRSRTKQSNGENSSEVTKPRRPTKKDEFPLPPSELLKSPAANSQLLQPSFDYSIHNLDTTQTTQRHPGSSQEFYKEPEYVNIAGAAESQSMSTTKLTLEKSRFKPVCVVLPSSAKSPQREVDVKYVSPNMLLKDQKLRFEGNTYSDQRGCRKLDFSSPN